MPKFIWNICVFSVVLSTCCSFSGLWNSFFHQHRHGRVDCFCESRDDVGLFMVILAISSPSWLIAECQFVDCSLFPNDVYSFVGILACFNSQSYSDEVGRSEAQ
jgi:hypothetical protein